MNFVRYTLFTFVFLMLAAGSVRAQSASGYTDDFSTDKARQDCHSSSIFWPDDIETPPARPYLTYLGTDDARGLVFMNYGGELAQLVYRFVAGAAPAGTTARGTFGLEVAFPCNAQIGQFPAGQLLCSTSADGVAWSVSQSLSGGHHSIPLQFTGGTCYVKLTGTRAVIDDVRVSPSTTGATLRVSPAGVTAAPTIHHVDVMRDRWPSYATIQAGVDAARNGDIVVVWPGVYEEQVRFKGRAITVQSAADAAVIMAPGGYAVSFYDAEGPKSILANFVIAGCGVAGIFCDGSAPTLRNLTITGNKAGITAYGGANPYITNCIIWGNINGPLSAWKANYNWRIYYSCLDPGYATKGAGNIHVNPQFANLQNADFHLKSPWGRYVAWARMWVFGDDETSPCLDAGDPADGPRAEWMPNGGRINMGACGGTPYASRSSGPDCP
ncbi:MAG: right-handed parallel beta-helix repeat-containing protein [Planctomycetes bacterium]|jgi:hypothetical protein|nr:right-handed parallel beta-helix repeat-containing protein [Planctomycetota bacterium]